ncbi:MAG: type 4a pilus biogenesis protein PilO [Acidithiobacillus sp.]|nr:type 4a pilus biogenesis protein PilO [Acidithiobacillus sp.]
MTWDEIKNLQLEDIHRLPTRTKVIGAVILVVLMGILAWIWFLSPENDKYKALTNQVETLKEQVRQKQLLAADLPAYQEQIREMNHRFERFLEQLPNRAQIPSLLDNVTLAGRSLGLEFNLFQPLPEVSKDFYAEIPVKIEVTGTYDDLGRFAAAVAAMPRIVTLGNLTITPLPGSGSTPLAKALSAQNLQVSCIATTYRYLDADQADKPQPGAAK